MPVILSLVQYVQCRNIIIHCRSLDGIRRGIHWSDDALDMMASGELHRLTREKNSYEDIMDDLTKQSESAEVV